MSDQHSEFACIAAVRGAISVASNDAEQIREATARLLTILLEKNGLVYEEVTLGKGITSSTLRAVSGAGTAPQVFIGGKLIGGADDLEKYFAGQQRKAA